MINIYFYKNACLTKKIKKKNIKNPLKYFFFKVYIAFCASCVLKVAVYVVH